MLDNILASKLYRPGSVAYVSRSGGMSNELNNIISRTTDGVYEGVAIGGDRCVCVYMCVDQMVFHKDWFGDQKYTLVLSVCFMSKLLKNH